MLLALLIPIVLSALVLGTVFIRRSIATRAVPDIESAAVGAIANFFDTLGIGSFAPTMAWFKFRGTIADRLIPCTMLVGYTPPSLVQAVIFLILLGVLVDPVLLGGCVIALITGALVGAPVAAKAKVWAVQMVVGVGLLVAALLFAMTNLDLMPGGGTAASLPPVPMAIAIATNFGFGVLLNFGIGNYAPTLIMLSLMGMDPRLSFPIMAGGAALAGTSASVRHIQFGEIDMRIAGGLALGGIPAVLVAAFIVKEMPLHLLRWLVVFVVLYAAAVMLRSAISGRRREKAAPAV